MSSTAQEPSLPLSLNLNVHGLKPSATLAINERSEGIRQQGRKVYKLGLGQSCFPVVPVVVEALQANAFQKDYLPVKGLPELRDAVSRYYCRARGDDVLIGPGSKELMFLLQGPTSQARYQNQRRALRKPAAGHGRGHFAGKRIRPARTRAHRTARLCGLRWISSSRSRRELRARQTP